MSRIVRWIDRLSGATGLIIAWLVFPLILASCYEVFSRYVLNAPTIWAFELGYMAMGTHALIGAAYTLKERGHIRIDVFYTHFRPKTRAMLDTLGYVVLFLPVMLWLCWGSWDYWVEAYLSGEESGQSAWNPLIWPFRFCFFFGLALLTLQGIAELIRCIRFLTGQTDDWGQSNPTGIE